MKKNLYLLSAFLLPCAYTLLMFSFERRLPWNNLLFSPVLIAYLRPLTEGLLTAAFYIAMLKLCKGISHWFRYGFYLNLSALLFYPLICVLTTIVMVTTGIPWRIGINTSILFVTGWQYSFPQIATLVVLYLFCNRNSKTTALFPVWEETP